jgi:cytochrome c peroxidase
VLNQFSDSVSIVDVQTRTAEHVALGDVRPPTETERGEMLFHDSTLSHDSWMSCQSCHSSGHSNGLLTDNFTDKTYRSPKRVLSLLGQADTAPYGWAGTMETLEDQIAFSIKSTMASDEAVRSEDVEQIGAYVRSLRRPPSLVEARADDNADPKLSASIARGLAFFNSAGCVDCHRGPQYTSPETYDVGLEDERELREFNPPSLIGVSQRHLSLLHDSRAKSLHDVIVKEDHQMPTSATDDERQDLIQFLMSL